jgi:hypothetical protein
MFLEKCVPFIFYFVFAWIGEFTAEGSQTFWLHSEYWDILAPGKSSSFDGHTFFTPPNIYRHRLYFTQTKV